MANGNGGQNQGLLGQMREVAGPQRMEGLLGRADPLRAAATATMPIPIVGDMAGLADDAQMFAQDPESRTPLNFGMSALGALPFVPSAGAIKGLIRGGDEAAESAQQPRIVFHDSASPDPIEVTGEGRFGGIFAGPEGGRGGQFRHAVALDPERIMTTDALNQAEDTDTILRELTDVAPDDFDTLRAGVVDDASFLDLGLSEDEAKRIFGGADMNEAAFNAQAMRGELARRLGAQAVEMGDETGTSLLVLPGARTMPLNEGEQTDQATTRLLREITGQRSLID